MALTINTPYTFRSANITENLVAALSSTLAVALWIDDATGDLYARGLTITGTTITANTAVTAVTITGPASSISISKIDSTHFIFTYYDDGDGDYYVRAGLISAGSISFGAAASIGSNYDTSSPPVCLGLTSSRAVIVGKDRSSSYLTGHQITVSGTALTVNSSQTIDGTITYDSEYYVDKIDINYFVISYRHNSGDTVTVRARVCYVTGTTITPGAEDSLTDSGTVLNNRPIRMVSTTTGILSFKRTTASPTYHEMGLKFTVSVSTITLAATPGEMETVSDLSAFRMSKFDSTTVMCVGNAGSVGTQYAYSAYYSGGSILPSNDTVTLASNAEISGSHSPIDYVIDNIAIVVYGDKDDGNYGKAVIISVSTVPNEKILSLSTPISGGDYCWSTIWDGSDLLLQKRNIEDLLIQEEINLGTCAPVELEVNYAAYVVAYDDNTVYVFGRMNDPQSLGDPSHIITTTDGGSSWALVQGGWAADFCDTMALDISAHTYALRSDGGFYYDNALRSTVPFSDFSLGSMRLFSTNYVAVARAAAGAAMVAWTAPPYTAWTDITSDHPTGAAINRLEIIE